MASNIVSVKLAGFTSGTSSVSPTGGTALGSLITINVMDNGGITFTDANSNPRRMEYSPELHALLSMLSVGTNGVSTAKVWHK